MVKFLNPRVQSPENGDFCKTFLNRARALITYRNSFIKISLNRPVEHSRITCPPTRSEIDIILFKRREGKKLKIADLTTEELKSIIREVMEEKFKEFLVDPDYGLELREEIEKRLSDSLTSKKRISLEEVKKRLGLSEI